MVNDITTSFLFFLFLFFYLLYKLVDCIPKLYFCCLSVSRRCQFVVLQQQVGEEEWGIKLLWKILIKHFLKNWKEKWFAWMAYVDQIKTDLSCYLCQQNNADNGRWSVYEWMSVIFWYKQTEELKEKLWTENIF